MNYLSPLLRKLLGGVIKHYIREREREKPGFLAEELLLREKEKRKKKMSATSTMDADIVVTSRTYALSAARKSSSSIDHFPAADIVHASSSFRHGAIIYQETRMGPCTFE